MICITNASLALNLRAHSGRLNFIIMKMLLKRESVSHSHHADDEKRAITLYPLGSNVKNVPQYDSCNRNIIFFTSNFHISLDFLPDGLP